jgi:hypothetical protein
MFKWICLAVAIIFLTVSAWLVNDLRLEIHRSGQIVQTAGDTINEQLPEIVDKARTTTETLADLAEDIRQLKELAGVSTQARDKNLVAYANSVLDSIETSGGTIGLKKGFSAKGLKNPVPAREWVVGARKEAVFLTILANSKAEFTTRLTRNKFHSPWYIQVGEQEPVTLLDWLKTHHPATRDLNS